MNKIIIIFSFLSIITAFLYFNSVKKSPQQGVELEQRDVVAIELLRKGPYPGSRIVIEETLASGYNYQRYIATYKSEGLKIYALLTIPNGQKPKNGWPVIIFNHGATQPEQYQPTKQYVAHVDVLARNGYIVFMSDYRGHGNSEGQAGDDYDIYIVDVLNAISSVKKLKDPVTDSKQIVDSEKIGMWGHSMGGHIAFESILVNKEDIKASVAWSALRFLHSGPLQIHLGEADTSINLSLMNFPEQLKKAKNKIEIYTYPFDNHDIAINFDTAMQRSVEFFDKYLKNNN